MKRLHCGLMAVVIAAGGIVGTTAGAERAAPNAASAAGARANARAVGLDQRVPWTTSRITGTPEPPLPYDVERAYPQLKFNMPVDLVAAPGRNRFFVVEQNGKILSFPMSADVAQADLAIDVVKSIPGVKQTYAIAFHPKFEQNGFCYVCAIRDADQPDGSRILRFRVADANPPTIDPASEHVVFTWPSGGHNGCCLQFGPDGFLYISTGDGTGPNPPDVKRTGQDVSDVLSSLLRIDVDHAEAGRNYRIPPDNPFVNTPGARPEIWAYGLRNPWRMSFDKKTGDLWVGDVGWELWEMLYRVERGANYGWAVMEGPQSTNPEWPMGPTPIVPATIAHPHSESSSITGGVTYYGTRLPELVGAHVYGDYDTGKIWAVRWQDGKVAWHRELADTTLRIVGFGEDSSGEMYLVHHIEGTLYRLVRNPERQQSGQFPRRLSETGLFSSVPEQVPAPGVIPYSVSAEPWEDGAVAQRWVAVPENAAIKIADPAWQFPKDSVLAKTISLDTGSGSMRRLETQILHFGGTDWRAYTYRWNDEQTDAELVDAAGADITVDCADAATPGKRTQRTWHLPSRAECLRCHNPWSGSAIGFQIAQLNKDHEYDVGPAPQLDTFFHIRLIEPPVPPEKRARLANPRDSAEDLEQRARAYLHVNCAHCHRMHAGSSVLSKMQYDLPLDQTTMVGFRPTQGTFGIHAANVITPGDPYRSVLLYRISKTGSGRMPHIGSQLVDPQGVALMERWISGLKAHTDVASADNASVDKTAAELTSHRSRLLKELREPKGKAKDRQIALADELLSSTNGALLVMRAIDQQVFSSETAQLVVNRAVARDDTSIRDLFERFLPEEKRVKRLGSAIRPDEILRLPGDAARGKRVFFETAGIQCKTCHRIEGVGKEVGPDLDQIGKKYTSSQLLENLLEPSKSVDAKYLVYVVETTDGRVASGLLMKRDGAELVLKDAQGNAISIPAAKVEHVATQRASLMPDLLLRDMTIQQVADLLAYLGGLK